MSASRATTVTALGLAQILGWGTSFYFPAVLAKPIVADTGWPLFWVVGGTSVGLLVAGLISPRVGRLIDGKGGRPALALSSCLYAAGLALIGLAPSLPVYLAGWLLVGGGMGTGLYDAVFAALGKLYGEQARGPITNLTLFGGFASTICWPLSAVLEETVGWRGTCLVYAAMHLLIALPLQMAVMPALKTPAAPSAANASPQPVALAARERMQFVLLALILTVSAGVGSSVIVHFMIFLQARGADLAVAVALGTLFGPAQVGARVIESLFGRHYHPIWTMAASCAGMAIGLVLLLGGWAYLWLAILIYGAGYGIMWIARGTLPLALFGADRYAILIGRLAFPSLIVQALAPTVCAMVIERHGADTAMAALTAFTALNVALIALMAAANRRP